MLKFHNYLPVHMLINIPILKFNIVFLYCANSGKLVLEKLIFNKLVGVREAIINIIYHRFMQKA